MRRRRRWRQETRKNAIKSFARSFSRAQVLYDNIVVRSLSARVHMVFMMRRSANASSSSQSRKSEPPAQQPVPRKKLSFREPEVVPRGKPRFAVPERADEYELDEELQVHGGSGLAARPL